MLLLLPLLMLILLPLPSYTSFMFLLLSYCGSFYGHSLISTFHLFQYPIYSVLSMILHNSHCYQEIFLAYSLFKCYFHSRNLVVYFWSIYADIFIASGHSQGGQSYIGLGCLCEAAD